METNQLIGEVRYAPTFWEGFLGTIHLHMMLRPRRIAAFAGIWLCAAIALTAFFFRGVKIPLTAVLLLCLPLLMVLMLLLRVRHIYRTGQTLEERTGKKGALFRFYADHFEKESAVSSVTLPYDGLDAIDESRKCFVLSVVRGENVLYVPKKIMDAATISFLHEKSRKTHRVRDAVITALVAAALFIGAVLVLARMTGGTSRIYAVEPFFFRESEMKETFATTQFCEAVGLAEDGTMMFTVNRAQRREWLSYADRLIESAEKRKKQGYKGWDVSISKDRKTMNVYGDAVDEKRVMYLWAETTLLLNSYGQASQITQIFSGEENWQIDVIVYDARTDAEVMRLKLPEEELSIPHSLFD